MTPETELERALRSSARAQEEDAADAAAALARRAGEQGLVEVAYGRVDSPMGQLLVAGTDNGLIRVMLPREDFDSALEHLAATVSPRLLEIPERVDAARRELGEYFEGARREFGLELDRRLIRGRFAEGVLERVSEVPFGRTITYGEAAALAGSPKAHRAAGNALGSNPIPIVIPCHRVVRAGNVLGGYGGGPEMKEYLLRHEGWLDGPA